MRYITDNKIRIALEKKSPRHIVNIDRPYISPALRAPNGDLMVLVFESLDELMYMTPDQSEAYSLRPIENEMLYALMIKAEPKNGSRFDEYLFFSTNKDWLEEYAKLFDKEARVEVTEIDNFVKTKAKGGAGTSQGAQRGE